MKKRDLQPDLVRLTSTVQAGDAAAGEALLKMLYAELRRVAGGLLRRESSGHTLQPTALVHEAFVRMIGPEHMVWEGRSHFLAVAAKAMRNVLVDHHRRRRTEKRGGAWHRVTLTGMESDGGQRHIDALELDDALTALAKRNERQARIVELRFYGGLSVEEVAEVLAISERTVELEWRMSRAWLRQRLEEAEPAP